MRFSPSAALAVLALLPLHARADEAAEVQKLLRAGELPAALARADKAVAADPRDARARFLRGVVLMDLSRDADALDAFRRMTQDFPELAEPYNNIALLEARAGRYDEALRALQAALRNDPQQPAARRNLGDVHLRLALQAWEASAKDLPDDPVLQRKLSLAREMAATR